VLQAGQGQIPSRQAQIKGGIPKEVPSETVNKVCASGMRSLGIADQAIRAGDLEVGVTGGIESMSQAPYLLPGARFGFRMGDVQAVDAMTHDGLTNPFTEKQMINEASEVSNELEHSPDFDRFASALTSWHTGRLTRHRGRIVSVKSKKRARRWSRPTRRSGPIPPRAPQLPRREDAPCLATRGERRRRRSYRLPRNGPSGEGPAAQSRLRPSRRLAYLARTPACANRRSTRS
jgi:acetyl-CoA acetyltransferase